jgi:type I restriction enzyme S subunit
MTTRPLGQIARVINGRAYKQEELLNSGKYRVLRVGNFFSNGSWYYSDLELEQGKYCEQGDLLFAWSASFGPKIWDQEKVIYHYHIWKIVEDRKVLDRGYLYYYLLNSVKGMMASTHGSIMLHLTKDFMERLPVHFPSDLKSQARISSILTFIDKKIDCNNRINAELEAMAKTLYDYWFVQFDFPDANGKPYKSSGGKMVYNPALKQEIPAGWESGALSEWIACDKTGDWGKESIEGNYTLQVDCIRGTDINGLNGTGGIAAPTRFILEKNRSKILEPFDFVIEISGGSPTQSTGRMAFALAETINRFEHPIICSNFCKAISLKDSAYFFNFAFEWRSAYDNKILFGWEGKTSGIKNLLFDAFVSKYLVCKPPQKLAQQFFEFVSPLQIQKQKLLRQNDELESLRDWLLPMLMNGQITVK